MSEYASRHGPDVAVRTLRASQSTMPVFMTIHQQRTNSLLRSDRETSLSNRGGIMLTSHHVYRHRFIAFNKWPCIETPVDFSPDIPVIEGNFWDVPNAGPLWIVAMNKMVLWEYNSVSCKWSEKGEIVHLHKHTDNIPQPVQILLDCGRCISVNSLLLLSTKHIALGTSASYLPVDMAKKLCKLVGASVLSRAHNDERQGLAFTVPPHVDTDLFRIAYHFRGTDPDREVVVESSIRCFLSDEAGAGLVWANKSADTILPGGQYATEQPGYGVFGIVRNTLMMERLQPLTPGPTELV